MRRRRETGDRKQEMGQEKGDRRDRRWETGVRRRETGQEKRNRIL